MVTSLLLASFMYIESSYALSVKQLSLKESIDLSDSIFIGTLECSVSGRLPDNDIVTHYLFSNVQWLKGESTSEESEEFVLQVRGGDIENEQLIMPSAPELKDGIRYILFIDEHTKVDYPIVGASQGIYQILPTTEGEHLVLNGYGELIIRNPYKHIEARTFESTQEVDGRVHIEPFKETRLQEADFTHIVRNLAAAQPGETQPSLTFGEFIPFGVQ